MCLFHFPGSRIPTTYFLKLVSGYVGIKSVIHNKLLISGYLWETRLKSFILSLKKKKECSLVVLDTDNTNVYVKVTAHFSSPFCPDKVLCEAYYLITVHFYA